MTERPPNGTEPDPPSGGGRWRLGVLTLIAVLAVVAGVVIFGGGDDTEPLPTLPTGLQPPSGAPGGGDRAPDFAVDLFSGERFVLSDHLATDGRPVLLNLWASWCPPCREEMPVFDEVAARRDDVVILGVAVDDAEAPARSFAEQIGATYPLAFDAEETVADRYPTPGLPATFAIAADGTVRRVVFGELEEDQIEALADELLG
ncbi:MAG: TlpA disulfide reductase family protein [Acidimicrobiia bacterium]|nr:TlpA disulfide reductase family protein [Acidimicrobiia bacterium]